MRLGVRLQRNMRTMGNKHTFAHAMGNKVDFGQINPKNNLMNFQTLQAIKSKLEK
jgi:hypothetical protein